MSAKKLVVALLIIIVAVGGFVAGLVLLRERQELREEAAVPGGQAEVSITPETGDYDVGETIETSVYFNPANIAVSGVAVRLLYPFSGSTPEISVSEIKVNTALTSTGDWTCPTQNSTQQDGNVVIDIACGNTSASGFTANNNVLLANVTLQVNRALTTSPLVARFDPAKSVVTRKSDNEDILLIPTSTGSYTVGGAVSTGTPTPTTRVTGAVTITPTRKLTVTPSSTISATPRPTSTQLPDAGVSYPTILGVTLGVLVIMAALLLAI